MAKSRKLRKVTEIVPSSFDGTSAGAFWITIACIFATLIPTIIPGAVYVVSYLQLFYPAALTTSLPISGESLKLVFTISEFIFTLMILFAYAWTEVIILKWEAKHTIVNGRRLVFTGKKWNFFGRLLSWGIFTVLTLGIYAFWLSHKRRKWILAHLENGERVCTCDSEPAPTQPTQPCMPIMPPFMPMPYYPPYPPYPYYPPMQPRRCCEFRQPINNPEQKD